VLGVGAALIGIALLTIVIVSGRRAHYATFEVVSRSWIREVKVERFGCPQFAPKCEPAAKTWTGVRTLASSGAAPDELPRWPDVQLARTGECDGCERAGNRREIYTVRFMDVARVEASCEFAFERWSDFVRGSKWVASKDDEGVLDCGALQRK
jgi:hypothetical protein